MLCAITVVVAFWALWNGAACCDLRPTDNDACARLRVRSAAYASSAWRVSRRASFKLGLSVTSCP